MARKRMIDPSLWQDWEFGRLSVDARVLFISCISNADDDGYLLANPMFLKSIAFLYDKTSPGRIQKIRDEVVSIVTNIHYFKLGNDEYLHLLRWEEYQNQRDDRRVTSRYPRCPQCVRHDDATMTTSSGHGAAEVKLSKLSKESQGEGSVKEGVPPRGGGVGLKALEKTLERIRSRSPGKPV